MSDLLCLMWMYSKEDDYDMDDLELVGLLTNSTRSKSRGGHAS